MFKTDLRENHNLDKLSGAMNQSLTLSTSKSMMCPNSGMLFTLGGREVAFDRLLCFKVMLVRLRIRNRVTRDIKNVLCDVFNIDTLVTIAALLYNAMEPISKQASHSMVEGGVRRA